MSLMDAYGLSLVSVQVWGALWGGLGLGFIVGGLYIRVHHDLGYTVPFTKGGTAHAPVP